MIQEWNYAHDADLTIGETHVSKIPKVLLICISIGLILITSVSIYFRNYIYDYITNPSIILKDSTINLEVHSKFNPEDYIANDDMSNFTYTIENSDINTDVLKTYKVIYNSTNRMHVNKTELTVNIVDTTGPEILLLDQIESMGCMLSITRGIETDEFNATKYLKSVKDNYTEKKDIKIEFTTDLDFSKDIVQIIYAATDKAGNITTKTMNIAVFENEEALLAELKQKQAEEDKKAATVAALENKNNNKNTSNTTTNDDTTVDNSSTTSTTGGTTSKTPAQPSAPFINGVHNITVGVDTDPDTIYSQLSDGVIGSGYVSIDASSVNPTVPGTYTAYFSSNDGVNLSCTVTVTE